MKKILSLLLIMLFLPALVLADPLRIPGTRNTITVLAPICVRLSTTGLCAAPATITCVTENWVEGATGPTAFTAACTNTPVAVGARNEVKLVTTAAEMNNDYAGYIISSNTANAMPVEVSFDNLHAVLTNSVNQAKSDLQKIKGFAAENGVTQTNGSPSTTAFKMDAADTRVYQPGQTVFFSFGSGAPDGESSIITGACVSSVCPIYPPVSAAVPSGVTYFVGAPSANLAAPGVELAACPTLTASGTTQLQFGYMMTHNKITCTNTLCTLFANDSSTPVCTWVPADNGTTASVAKAQ
jgi:hypothetical protein